MKILHTSIGGGVVGSEILINTINKILNDLKKGDKLKKDLCFCVLDKNHKNFFGGIAYSFLTSQFGYFNNPIRLSPDKFQNWLKQICNREEIIEYLKLHEDKNGENWLKNYSKIFLSGPKKNNYLYNELYLPRVALSFWIKYKYLKLQKKILNHNLKNKKKIKIVFIKSEVKNLIKKKNYFKIYLKSNAKEHQVLNKKETLNFITKEKKNKILKTNIISKAITISLGLMAPKKINSSNVSKKLYIHDFYGQGSSKTLLKKIFLLKKKKKEINLLLIGNKAGFLEPLNELKKIIFYENIKIKIYCFSKDTKFLNYAIQSCRKYNLKYINKKKIYTANQLFNSILNEFLNGKKKKYKKYDVWTEILKKKIINKHFNSLNPKEKEKYKYLYFDKIRSITRFTNPETLKARDYLKRKKKLFFKKYRVEKIKGYKDKLLVYCDSRKNAIFSFDMIVNVSGPNSLNNVRELPVVLKKLHNLRLVELKKENYLVDQYFRSKKCKEIYIPNMMAFGFNPNRETVINAILKNTEKSANNLHKSIKYNYV